MQSPCYATLFLMFDFIAPFALFVFINLLGAMSPGPDFAIVTRYGLTGSRKAALQATAGVSMALLIHVSYCLFGIVYIFQKIPMLYLSIQTAGALYLFYLGLRLILAKEAQFVTTGRLKHRAFLEGFLTNLLNPKASLFLLSLFVQFTGESTPLWEKILYGLLVPATGFGWFSFLSLMITHRRFLPHLQKYQLFFMKAMGLLLIALSLLVFVSLF